MAIGEYKGKAPRLSETAYVAAGALAIGDVRMEEETSLWFNAVVRGDIEKIVIGKGSNVQDGSVVHVSSGFPCTIGEYVVVGHNVVLHGCNIGDRSVVGISSTILDGARIGEGSIVAAGSLIPPGKEFPERSFILGAPGKRVRDVTDEEYERNMRWAIHYIERSREYRDVYVR